LTEPYRPGIVASQTREEMVFRRSGSMLLTVALLGTAPLPLAA